MSIGAEEYRRRTIQVLDGTEYGEKQLMTLTDAEVLALDGPDAAQVTPLLSLQPPISEQQRLAAADEAAKRLFDTEHSDDGTPLGGTHSSEPEPTVRTVLQMRSSWVAQLLFEQVTALGRQWITICLRADRYALAEVATGDGRHQFSAMKRAAALDTATTLLTPIPESTDADGDGELYPLEGWEEAAGPALAKAKIVSTVLARRRNEALEVTDISKCAIYNFDDHTKVLRAEGSTGVRLAPIARPTLREWLDDSTRPRDEE